MTRFVHAAGFALAAILGGCGGRPDLDDAWAFDPSVPGHLPAAADDASAPPRDASEPSDGEASVRPFAGKLPAPLPDPEEGGAAPRDADDKEPPQLPYSLVLYGTAFESAEGSVVGAAVVRMPEHVIVDTRWRVVAGGSFFLPFPAVLQQDLAFRVDYFVDKDADGLCQPNHDRAWRVELPATVGDIDLEVHASDPNFAGACAAF